MDVFDAAPAAQELADLTAAEQLKRYMDAFLDLYRSHSDILRFNYHFNGFLRNEQVSPEQIRPYLDAAERARQVFFGLYEKGTRTAPFGLTSALSPCSPVSFISCSPP